MVDNEKNLCQNEQLHLLTAIKERYISGKFIGILKALFYKTHIEKSLLKKIRFWQLRNQQIVILNLICFVANIALNDWNQISFKVYFL